MTRSMIGARGLVIATLALAPAVRAQSTSTLGGAADSMRVEIAVGAETMGDAYSGEVTAAYGAWRAFLEGPGAWRLMGWVMHRRRDGTDQAGQRVTIRHRATVIGAGPDYGLSLPGTVARLTGFVGLGYAALYASHPEYAFDQFRDRASGWSIVFGAGVNVRHFTVQQHFVIIHGADNTLQVNREYYPLMVGFRF